MTDKKISQLAAATTPLAGTEVLPIVQGGSTVKVSAADVTAGRSISTAGASLDGAVTINESGADVDFRIESDTQTHAFFLDGTNGNVGIGTGSPLVRLHLFQATAGEQLRIESTDAGDSHSPLVALFRNSSSPADGDGLGQINFLGEDAVSNQTIYASISGSIEDVSNGTEDGRLTISTIVGGSQRNRIDIRETSTIINEDGENLDFRVEGDTKPNLFLIDASADTINIDGNIVPSAGVGIDFSANTGAAGMTSELLDWYEEGTWTPTVVSSSGTITTVGTCTGQYTRIGRQVTLSMDLRVTTNGTGAGFLSVTGIPFTMGSTLYGAGCGSEIGVTGNMLQISPNNTTTLGITDYDGTYPAADGFRGILTWTYFV